MKFTTIKYSLFSLFITFFCLAISAQDNKSLSKKAFRCKQQAFLIKKASITQEEAKLFFPVYFELQDKISKINENFWKTNKQIKNKQLSEEEYDNLIRKNALSKIESDKLELLYNAKFRKIISAKKLYRLKLAEISFRRELLKNFQKINKRGNVN